MAVPTAAGAKVVVEKTGGVLVAVVTAPDGVTTATCRIAPASS